MGKVIQYIYIYELKKLCSDDANSVQQSKEKEKICNFPWKEVIAEIIKYCPTLYKLLLSGTTTKAVRQNRQHLPLCACCASFVNQTCFFYRDLCRHYYMPVMLEQGYVQLINYYYIIITYYFATAL